MTELFNTVYKDKTVLVTGHTGFKGSWLCYWLQALGAKVIGYSLPAPTKPSHFDLLKMQMDSVIGDIRDFDRLNETIQKYSPDIVFHLAAQPLVRYSYSNPIETYETNVIGTLKVFEACRINNIQAIVNVTSDKCYENREWVWGYRENDPMGGYDPYSSSKGCAEILTGSYRSSYFNRNKFGETHHTLLASCRAGNVIGGGDWAQDRLVSDVVISASQGQEVVLRNPAATRPWQHVLEPLSGYLQVGQKLMEEEPEFASGWNFGPGDQENICVEEAVKSFAQHWDKVQYRIESNAEKLHEANLLKLDCSKAHIRLKWQSVWQGHTAFEKTMKWYRAYYENHRISTQDDLHSYVKDAKAKQISWTCR